MPASFPGISKGGRTRGESPAAFPSGLLTLHEPSEAIVDLVFVHGLSGDREKTWASGDESGCWPKERLPAEVPKARILTFGYDAYITRSGGVSKNKIRDHARDLVNQLANARMTEEKNSRPIIFVVHSLGGIVCKDALQVSTGCAGPHLQAIAATTRAILFAATPHEGSSTADWAKVPASTLGIIKQTNVNLLKILQTTSEVRDRIHDDFLTLLRKRQLQGPPLDITCLFESLTTGPIIVVPHKSAVISGYNNLSIRADHRDIVRMGGGNSEGADAIVRELKRWIEAFAMEFGEVAGIDPRRVRRCVQALIFTQIYDRQSAIERASDDTCAWIFDHHLYQAWSTRQDLENSHGILWIKGKPGSGKSTLMKFLVEKAPHSLGHFVCCSFSTPVA
jgi:protein SERAC1